MFDGCREKEAGGAASPSEGGLAETGSPWWDSASCLIDSNLAVSLQRDFQSFRLEIFQDEDDCDVDLFAAEYWAACGWQEVGGTGKLGPAKRAWKTLQVAQLAAAHVPISRRDNPVDASDSANKPHSLQDRIHWLQNGTTVGVALRTNGFHEEYIKRVLPKLLCLHRGSELLATLHV